MDKPSPFAASRPSEKRGFALIITLSVLTVIIALTGVLISYLDIARKDADKTEALIQANLYFSDIKNILTQFKDKKALYNILYASPFPLQSEDGRFSMLLACRPLTNGVNINWLAYANDPLMEAQYNAVEKVFEVLAQEYEIEDPSLLEEMLYKAVKGSESENLETQSRLVQKNGIISYKQFEYIVSRYQMEADDQKIGQIPWKKYFVFNPVNKDPEENKIAGGYMSEELLSALFDIDKEALEDGWSEGEGSLKQLLAQYGITPEKKLYAEKFIDQSHCRVTYAFNGKQFMFAFIDKEGEVKDFEFYGEE
jgi:hypothetical protein